MSNNYKKGNQSKTSDELIIRATCLASADFTVGKGLKNVQSDGAGNR